MKPLFCERNRWITLVLVFAAKQLNIQWYDDNFVFQPKIVGEIL